MTATFRYASLTSAKPLIGLYAESGRGKTYSALLLARGYTGPAGKIGMIETETGRGEAYVDMIEGGYDVCPLRAPFSPTAYGEAIKAAEAAKYDALIIDSASHEWEGEGGVLAMAADNQSKGMTGVIVWQKPKISHQRDFIGRLMQTPIPLVIICMRAKYPMQQGKDSKGKTTWVRSEVVEPKQADDFLFEMFVHGWIDDDHQFRGTKYTRPDLREIIRDKERISTETGARLAAWSKGIGDPSSVTSLPPDNPDLIDKARNVAEAGADKFREWFAGLNEEERVDVRPHLDELEAIAKQMSEQ